jgi:molybdate transport system ATP-binding protein
MEKLELSIRVPLRSFDVELALDVPPGVLALVGPSGAGKSTILRAIAGLLRPSDGRIALGPAVWFDRERKIHLEPERRSVGLVFQDYALFPHLTVAENVAFGSREPVDAFLARFKIEHLARVRPAGLSGGERQRVALARALARRPSVVLLDEPMSALDASTREGVRVELGQILRSLALPTVLVSHDFGDAAALAENVAVIVDGQVVQYGTPQELVENPTTPFVASFTGSNLLSGHARIVAGEISEVILESGGRIRIAGSAEGRVGVALAPWDVTISRDLSSTTDANQLELTVSSIVPMGDRSRVSTNVLAAEVPTSELAQLDLRSGEPVVMAFAPSAARLVPLANSGTSESRPRATDDGGRDRLARLVRPRRHIRKE